MSDTTATAMLSEFIRVPLIFDYELRIRKAEIVHFLSLFRFTAMRIQLATDTNFYANLNCNCTTVTRHKPTELSNKIRNEQ